MNLSRSIICLRISLKEVPSSELGKFTVVDRSKLYQEAKKIASEFLYLQKCNCVEMYFVLKETYLEKSQKQTTANLMDFWREHAFKYEEENFKRIIIEKNDKACLHLIRVATSLESAVLGDGQVLGQVKAARQESIQNKSFGPILRLVVKFAILADSCARKETRVHEGNVSIGRAVYEFVGSDQKLYRNKKVLIVGAGQMGKLILKLFTEIIPKNKLTLINRSLDKAKSLSLKYDINYDTFENLEQLISTNDIVVLATASSHPIVTTNMLRKVKLSHNLLIIDIGNPSNVETDVVELDFVKVVAIDYLREVAQKNLLRRTKQVKEVEQIVFDHLDKLKKEISILESEEEIRKIYIKAQLKKKDVLDHFFKKLPRDDSMFDTSKAVADSLSTILCVPFGRLRNLMRSGNLQEAKLAVKIMSSLFEDVN